MYFQPVSSLSSSTADSGQNQLFTCAHLTSPLKIVHMMQVGTASSRQIACSCFVTTLLELHHIVGSVTSVSLSPCQLAITRRQTAHPHYRTTDEQALLAVSKMFHSQIKAACQHADLPLGHGGLKRIATSMKQAHAMDACTCA